MNVSFTVNYTTFRRLLDNNLALHASALVGLAVVAVGAGHVELGGDGVARAVQVVLVGQRVRRHARRDGVLVEDDVVGEALVVDPGGERARGGGSGGWSGEGSRCRVSGSQRCAVV
jgi:hypothetical protein